jgi:hypothetical protein
VFVVAVAGIVVIGPGLGGFLLRDELTVSSWSLRSRRILGCARSKPLMAFVRVALWAGEGIRRLFIPAPVTVKNTGTGRLALFRVG